MNRFLQMPLLIQKERVSGQFVISVEFPNVILRDWCLNLCLLKESLVDALVISGNKKLEINRDESIGRKTRARVNVKSGKVQIAVHPIELDYWLSFFLKYYRDGLAEVDHLDVEAINASSEDEELYLVFKVAESVPPVSTKEARKRLNMD